MAEKESVRGMSPSTMRGSANKMHKCKLYDFKGRPYYMLQIGVFDLEGERESSGLRSFFMGE